MTLIRIRPRLLAGLMAGALCCGCSQKKPVVAVPQTPAASAPQPAPESAPSPEPQPQDARATPAQGTPPPEPQPDPTPVQPQPAQPIAEKANSVKPKTASPHSNGKKPATEARTRSPKTTVSSGEEPVPATGQISPTLSDAEIARSQTTTQQLLESASATLNSITRQLSEEEQAIATQVREYMNQSRLATKANDFTRAYNLALKARLLSDDLAKRH